MGQAMTPVKEVWVILDTVFAVDFAGKLNLVAHCPSEEIAIRTAVNESTYHNREAYMFNVVERRMRPLGAIAESRERTQEIQGRARSAVLLTRAMKLLEAFTLSPEGFALEMDVSVSGEFADQLRKLREDYSDWKDLT